MRTLPYLITLIITIAIAAGVFRVSSGYFQSEELSKSQGRLSLYKSSVAAEFERFSHLTYVLARDPYVIAGATGTGVEALNLRLEDFANQAELDAIYLMNTDGLTIAASNHRTASSFIGQTYAFRPYFRNALNGEQGRFYAIGATTGLPGYFLADAVRDEQDTITGVIAIKIDFSQLEESWRNSGEQVLLANADGVVLLSSDPAWRYRALAPLSTAQREKIDAAKQFPGQALDPLDWTILPEQAAYIAGAQRIHVSATDMPQDWQLHYFASDDRAVARSWLVTAVFVFAAGLALIVFQIQRAQRVGAALARSEKEEAQLREANARLAIEIEDRNRAERRLKRTEGELERASRLAALGQLAASVTHELGQPIAAMRNHLTAAEIGSKGPTGLTGKIGDLVDRMEGITRQLKFFARSESEQFEDVDLRETIHAALALVEPNVTETGARMHIELPVEPVMVRANRLRIEQVMTNLLRNATDAIEDAEIPTIRVHAGTDGDTSWVEISDNGHGLGTATLADLQEPFVTTRESGRGMGLGLAISAGIVKDHDGKMSAQNIDSGGALFRISFPRHVADESKAA